jgi:hypothetical protein
MYSADFVRYTVTPGSRGKSVFTTPAQLAQLGTLSQLNRLCANVCGGKRFSSGTAKATVAEFIVGQLNGAAELKGGHGKALRPLRDKVKADVVAGVARQEAPGGGRVVCRIDTAKIDAVLASISQPLLRECLVRLTADRKGVVEVTREAFTAAKITAPRGGDAWRNFLWYKSKGLLKAVQA